MFIKAPSLDKFIKMKKINEIIKLINDANYLSIQKYYSKEMLVAFPLDQATSVFNRIIYQNGKIIKWDSPRIIPLDQLVFPLYFEHGRMDLKLIINNNDEITGLWFIPPTFNIPVPEKHETKLFLPFKGSWLVYCGGDTSELNYHFDVASQRFAFDFFAVNEKGEIQKDNGENNEDYFGFSKEILAPADGLVTDVISGVRDNKPWSMNPQSAVGNAILIKHREYEFSILLHLKFDSIRVKVGDNVGKGQIIGLCGNSGNSARPHLHYHLENTNIIQDGTSIKCYFENIYLIKGTLKEKKPKYSPIKGEIICTE